VPVKDSADSHDICQSRVMEIRAALTDIRSLYILTISTPRLELRLPAAMEIVELSPVARRGIQQPGEPRYLGV
jgi:hypothetical protein